MSIIYVSIIVVYPYAYSNKKSNFRFGFVNTVTASLFLQRVSFSLVNFAEKMRYMWQGVVFAISRRIRDVKIAANSRYVCQDTYWYVLHMLLISTFIIKKGQQELTKDGLTV